MDRLGLVFVEAPFSFREGEVAMDWMSLSDVDGKAKEGIRGDDLVGVS